MPFLSVVSATWTTAHRDRALDAQRDDPEQARTTDADEAAETEHHAALILLRDGVPGPNDDENDSMPALIDTEPKDGDEPISIFESGAIMMYLAERETRFWPQMAHKKYDVVQWMMWQMANQGPKFGEQGHFLRAVQTPANGDQS